MKSINKKDFQEVNSYCMKLVENNLHIIDKVESELGFSYECESPVVGGLYIHFDKFYKYEKVYHFMFRFKDIDRVCEAYGRECFKNHGGDTYNGKMAVGGFADDKERVMIQFYDVIEAIIEGEIIE